MAKVRSKLYTVAVGYFKLKDRVVRHLQEELQRFKKVYRSASALA